MSLPQVDLQVPPRGEDLPAVLAGLLPLLVPDQLVPTEGLPVGRLVAAHRADHLLPQLLQLAQLVDRLLVLSPQHGPGELLPAHSTGELLALRGLELLQIF